MRFEETDFRTVCLAGRPVLSVPQGGAGCRHGALRALRPYSYPRRVVRGLSRPLLAIDAAAPALGTALGVRSGVSGFLPHGKRDMGVLEEVLGECGSTGPATHWTILWPLRFMDRIFLHGFDEAGDMVDFAKIGLSVGRAEVLRREADVIAQLPHDTWEELAAPRLLGEWRGDGWCALRLGVLPDPESGRQEQRRYPASALRELHVPTEWVAVGDIMSAEWFVAGLESVREPVRRRIHGELRDAERRVRLTPVHGDVGPGNFLKAQGRTWLFDWDNYCERGPRLVDCLSYYITVRRPRIKRSPKTEIRRVMRNLVQRGAAPEEVTLALVYLSQFFPQPVELLSADPA